MKRAAFLAGAFALACLASGCAAVATATKDAASDIDLMATTLSSPAVTQAVNNLQKGAKAISCDISGLAALTEKITIALRAGTAKVQDAATLYTVSSDVCAALGGAPGASVVVAQ